MNVKKILNQYHIPFIDKHAELSKGAVGMNCPFCDDHKFHLGVFLTNGAFSCWKCKVKGNFYKLLSKVKHISYDEYCEVVGKGRYKGGVKGNLDNIFTHENTQRKKDSRKVVIPKGSIVVKNSNNALVKRFIKERKFSLEMVKYFGCRFMYAGEYASRLIVPIPAPSISKDVIGFVARDLSGNAGAKYKFPTNFFAHDNVYQTHKANKYKEYKKYGIDVVVIVEGTFDAWAVSKHYPAVALFGKYLYTKQLNILIDCLDKNTYIIICLDGDTFKSRLDAKKKLSQFFKNVGIAKLPKEHDPASIDSNELYRILNRKLEGMLNVEKAVHH